jgi:GIY-YIG catalytic domain
VVNPRSGPAALYRFFDIRGTLLWVGATQNFGRRWANHASTQEWWHRVTLFTVMIYPSWDEARRYEDIALATERPFYNSPLPGTQAAALHATELIRMLGGDQPPRGNRMLTAILADLHRALTEFLEQP